MPGTHETYGARKTVCFDLDGTLCTNTFGDYDSAEPFPWAVERVNQLARAGHRIVVFTARGTATGINWKAATTRQLERWGVRYDELRFGKPSADVYVDDRAVHTTAWRCGDMSDVPGFTAAEGDLPGIAPAHLASVVEVGRTFGGRPLRLDLHARRTRELAERTGIRPLPTVDELTDTARAALARAAGGDDDLVFTISVSAGGHAAFADTLQGDMPHCLAFCRPLRHAAAGLPSRLLSAANGAVVLAATTASGRADGGWPLAAGEDGTLHDALGGRLGIVAEGRIVLEETAAPSTVASGWLVELAREIGIDIVERGIGAQELSSAAEAFVAGFPFCILPLGALDGRPSWPGAPGPLTRALLDAWSRSAGVEIAGQTAAALGAHGS